MLTVQRYRVQSGDLDIMQLAADAEQAARFALQSLDWNILGKFMMVTEPDTENTEPVYIWTQYLLEKSAKAH